ncbi:hypothetical protein PMAYCL1PPCAC_33327, partial [Pristionchus mayeri]
IQMLLHAKNLPHFETKPASSRIHRVDPLGCKLILLKSLRGSPVPEGREACTARTPLRIYQDDRLDELWLERINREHAANRLPMMNLAMMLNLINEFEIECFKNIHRIVLTSLALTSPCSTNNSSDGE